MTDEVKKLLERSMSFRRAATCLRCERKDIVEEALECRDINEAIAVYRGMLAEAVQSISHFEQVPRRIRGNLDVPMTGHEFAASMLAKECVLTIRAIRKAYQTRKGC